MRITITILLLSISHLIGATTYYISNSGSDAAAGTSSGTAWATITKLNTVSGSLSAGDIIAFECGGTFDGAITSLSNGSSGNRIKLTSYGTGAKPILTGFQTLSSWSNLGGNIWEATGVNSGAYLNVVTLDGIAIAPGRTPNTGSYYAMNGSTNSFPAESISSSDINTTTIDYTGATAVVRSSEYTRDYNLITSASGNTLYFANAQSPRLYNSDGGFFIQGDVRTLDQQNEWFYNSAAHTIRMYSTSDPSTIGTGVKAAVYNSFIYADYLDHIEFNNLKFQGYDSVAIRVFHYLSTQNKVVNCDFDQVTHGIEFLDGDNDTISNNNFTNIYATAIKNQWSTYPVITNNNINGCGLVIGLGVGNIHNEDGINCVNLDDSAVIKYNDIRHVGYVGIYFDGNNSVVRSNVIDSFCTNLADGGGINTCCNNITNTPGIGLRHVDSNIVTNGIGGRLDWLVDTSPGAAMGLYMDDQAGEISLTNNTVRDANRAGILLHNTDSIYIVGNTFYQTNDANAFFFLDDALPGTVRHTTFKNNIMYVQPGVYFGQLESEANDYDQMGTFADNSYARSATGQILATRGYTGGDYSFSTWKSTFGYDKQSAFTTVVDDSVRLDYSTSASKYVLYTNTVSSLTGVPYYQYINIPAYTSLLVYRKTYESVKTGRPVKVIQQ